MNEVSLGLFAELVLNVEVKVARREPDSTVGCDSG